jgi:hypothetical protein
MKLLINGFPCCGKTTFGDWLRDNHGYRHIDFEDGNGNVHCATLFASMGVTGVTPPPWTEKVVATWAFMPSPDNYKVIGMLVSFGFTAWWFDGDLRLARERSIARDGLPNTVHHFDSQVTHLTNAREEIAKIYSGRMITTLSSAGYLSCAEILDRLSR